MISQIVAIVLLLFGNRYLGRWDLAGDVAVWVVVALAILSAIDYFLRFSRRLGVVEGREGSRAG